MLASTFGATGPAIVVTTAAFMAGLGIGSHAIGKVVDRSRRPARLYATLEVCIAILAGLMPQGIAWIERSQSRFISAETFWLAQSLQFLGIFLLLVVPTALMGATLPVLTRAIVQSSGHLGRRFSWLYGMNTFGAAMGALLTGFYLIPEHGIQQTIIVGIFLNLTAGVIALSFKQTQTSVTDSPSESSESVKFKEANHDVRTGPIHVAVFVSGFVALACQYHWTRSLIFSFDRLKNTTYSFSAVLTVTLFALVLGTFLAYLVVDRLKKPVIALAVVIGCVGISAIGSVVLLLWLPPLQDSIDPRTLRVDFGQSVFNVVLRSAIIIGIPTTLMGITLPLAVRIVGRENALGTSIGRLYACNTWGAVAGAFLGAYLITPVFGLAKGLVVLGLIELALAFLLLSSRRRTQVAVIACMLISLTAWKSLSPEHWSLSSLLDGEHVVRYRDGPMATVSVIENDRGERRISVDDVPVAGTSKIMQTDQKSLAHWSMMLAGNPRRALTVGFGSGGASYSFLLHDQLEHLDCVEICRDVPRFANLLTAANHGLLEGTVDPRYRIIYADARAYLQSTTIQYDAVVSDCTDLRYRSSANLYDLEYFQLCRERLTDQGCTVIWMPLGGLSADAFRLTLRTFCHVFPKAGVFYLHNRWTHYVLLVGHKSEPKISLNSIREILSENDVREDMAEIGMTDPYKILATFVTSADQMQPLIAGEELNTENHPILEFAVPKYDTGPWSAQRNLNLLRQYHSSVRPWLTDDLEIQEQLQIDNFQRAASNIIAAQEAERQTQVERATKFYLAAQKATPSDPAIAQALQFPELRKIAETGQPTAWLLLGRSQQLQGLNAEAIASFDHYLANMLRLASPQTPADRQLLEQAKAWQASERQWRVQIENNRAP